MNGLILKKKWLDLIVEGKKTLEIRGNATHHVGEPIYLLESGTQRVRGTCVIEECILLDKDIWDAMKDKHQVYQMSFEELKKRYKTPYAWKITNVSPAQGSLYYQHPMGAVIWVKDVLTFGKTDIEGERNL